MSGWHVFVKMALAVGAWTALRNMFGGFVVRGGYDEHLGWFWWIDRK